MQKNGVESGEVGSPETGETGKVGSPKTGETGKVESLAPVSPVRKQKDELGRFLPGNTLGKGQRASYLYRKAVADAIPPEMIAEWLMDAARMAKTRGSPRGMMAVAALALSYAAGKPATMKDNGEEKPNLAALLGLLPDDVVGDDVIEGEGWSGVGGGDNDKDQAR